MESGLGSRDGFQDAQVVQGCPRGSDDGHPTWCERICWRSGRADNETFEWSDNKDIGHSGDWHLPYFQFWWRIEGHEVIVQGSCATPGKPGRSSRFLSTRTGQARLPGTEVGKATLQSGDCITAQCRRLR